MSLLLLYYQGIITHKQCNMQLCNGQIKDAIYIPIKSHSLSLDYFFIYINLQLVSTGWYLSVFPHRNTNYQ